MLSIQPLHKIVQQGARGLVVAAALTSVALTSSGCIEVRIVPRPTSATSSAPAPPAKKPEYQVSKAIREGIEGIYPITEKSHRQDRPCPCTVTYDEKRQEFVGITNVSAAGYQIGDEIFNLKVMPRSTESIVKLEGFYSGRVMGDGGLANLSFLATARISSGKTEITGYVTGPIDPPQGYLKLVRTGNLPKKQ